MRHTKRDHRVWGAALTGAVAAGLVLAAQAPASADVVKGGPADNTLHGTDRADTIYGYKGNDTLYGAGGGDEVRGGEGADDVYGGPGQDTLTGHLGADKLFGGTFDDKVYGGAGPDMVKGGDGNDQLFGGDGNDTIRGRDGTRDRITCGSGKDEAILDWRDHLAENNRCEIVRRPAITYATLRGMYGAKLGAESVVREGLASLNNQTDVGNISRNARRTAAFLATLVNESALRYDALQGGGDSYRGRGFIQLTGSFNYDAAGDYFDVNLLAHPGKARSLRWSAKIARWYWTVARPDTNRAADRLNMAKVNENIGFAPTHAEYTERCNDFKSALRRLTGNVPSGITCY